MKQDYTIKEENTRIVWV